MNTRLSNSRSASSATFAFLKPNSGPEALEDAIKQLEDCVKHGLLFHAAQLSDWIMFVAADALSKNPSLSQRLRLERLKRLGYLHFFEQEQECRDELCRTEKLEIVLDSQSHPSNDDTRWRLYSAIGHTMWHEDNLEQFTADYQIYSRLFSGLSERFNGRAQMHAFLLGIEGRLHFLSGADHTLVVEKFDSALSLLSSDQRRTRVGLHLINYYLNHLLSLYMRNPPLAERELLSRRIEELFVEFADCRIGAPQQRDAKLQPIKTLLQINFGLHRLRKLTTDIRRLQLENEDVRSLESEVQGVKADLLFTTVMLGLGSLNPCPPLLRDVYDYCTDQHDGVDLNQVKSQLKAYLRNISWKGFEEVVSTYFCFLNYHVELLPERSETFDILVHVPATGFHSKGTIAVQVKHKHFSTDEFRKWRQLAFEYPRRDEITSIVIVAFNRPDVSIKRDMKNLRLHFPLLQDDIQFWDINHLTELLWRTPGCLPEIYGLIEKWRGAAPLTKRTRPTA